MRRFLSILLLLCLGLGPGTDLLSASTLATALRSGWTGKVDESRLPACCRRNGKHHCVMSSQQASTSDGETTISANDCCPCVPLTLASTAPITPALLTSASTAIHSLAETPSPLTRTS